MIIPSPAELRGWSRTALGLRVLMAAAGLGAVSVGLGAGGLPLTGAVVAALGLLAALVRPGGLGPGVVIAGSAGAWLLRYGADQPPVAGTLLLALALALHHQAAALAAALPVRARVHRDVLVRFARHGGLVLALTAVVAAVALGIARPGGSVPLELLGLAAAVAAISVPVLLSRTGGR
ncbi:MAG TPA: hypothetical protein VI357_22675 [Mycobacteriales bacterium]